MPTDPALPGPTLRELAFGLVEDAVELGEDPVADDHLLLLRQRPVMWLLQLDDFLGQVAKAARRVQTTIRTVLKERGGRWRLGEQAITVGQSARWVVQDDDRLWDAIGKILAWQADETTGPEWVEGAADAIRLIRKLLPTRNLRVSALRAAAIEAGFTKEQVDDGLLERVWSDSLSLSYRPLADAPKAAQAADPELGAW